MGGDAPIQRKGWSQFSSYSKSQWRRNDNSSVSPVDPHGVDVVSIWMRTNYQISLYPKNQRARLERRRQITSLSASAAQNAGRAATPEQLKTGVIPPTSVIPPNRDDL